MAAEAGRRGTRERSDRPRHLPRTGRRAGARFLPGSSHGEGHGVTTLELFFDLVFVFAITQVTAFMADDLGWRGLLRGLVLLALLWWAWCSYAWLGNQAHADEGVVRAALVVADGGAVPGRPRDPRGMGRRGRGISAPVVLAVAFAVVRAVHLGGLRRRGGRRRGTAPAAAAHRRCRSASRPCSWWSVRVLGGVAQTALWALALVVDYTGVYLSGTDWRLPSPAALRRAARPHRDHRAGGVDHRCRRRGGRAADHAADHRGGAAGPGGQRGAVVVVLRRGGARGRTGPEQQGGHGAGPAGPRQLHLPALPDDRRDHLPRARAEEGRRVRGDTEHHALTDPLKGTGLWALYGGVAMYLIAHLAFRMRNVGSINRPRAVVAVLLLVAPLGVRYLPALAALGVLALVLGALIAFEVVRYAEARAAIRAEAAHH